MKEYIQYKGISLTKTGFDEYGKKITMANSKNELLVFSDRSKNVFQFDLKGNLLREFEANKKGVRCASFSQDDKLIVTGGKDCTVKLFESESGKLLWTSDKFKAYGSFLDRPYRNINHIEFINSNEIMAIGSNFVAILSTKQGVLLRKLPAVSSEKHINNFAINSERTKVLLCWSDSKTIRPKGMFNTSYEQYYKYMTILDIESLNTISINLKLIQNHVDSKSPICFLTDNTFITGVERINTYDLSGSHIDSLKSPLSSYYDLDASKNGKYLIISGMYENSLMELENRNNVKFFRDGSGSRIHHIKFSQDSNFICGVGTSNEIKVWNLSDLIN